MKPLFSFRENPKPAIETAEIPAPDQGNIAASQAAEAAIAASKTSRKPRSDAGKSRQTGPNSSGASEPSAELRAEISKQLEAAYNPKAWASLLALPADVTLAISGNKIWDVSKDERETMGACGSVAARYLMEENPKTLALLMLSSALFAVYVPRITEHLRVMRAKNVTPEKKPVDAAVITRNPQDA